MRCSEAENERYASRQTAPALCFPSSHQGPRFPFARSFGTPAAYARGSRKELICEREISDWASCAQSPPQPVPNGCRRRSRHRLCAWKGAS